MRLKYHFSDRESNPHPFLVKLTWQPSLQPSVALERYLERIKLEIASMFCSNAKDNLSAQERPALSALRANKKVNIRKADKGTTTFVMDTQDKIREGNVHVCDTNFYTRLQDPIESSTAKKVSNIVNLLYTNNHIDTMTFKWLNQSQNPPRIPEFYIWRKIHKPNPVGRSIVSSSGGPTERISSFIDSLLKPIAKNTRVLYQRHHGLCPVH